jgi:phosphoribosylanthranilate isomerase
VVVEVKICGLTRPGDAELAARYGASRLGVVLAWGPRVVNRDRLREIVAAARGVPVLGVVADAPVEELLQLAAETGLSGLQLHQGGTAPVARRLRAAGLEVWRAASLETGADVERVLAERREDSDAVLVEPRTAHGAGGLGVALSHDMARRARVALAGSRMVLAGGLTPETVRDAIEAAKPDLVDVSSGVESAPGKKAPELLIRFLENVRDAGSTSRAHS